NNDRLSSCMLLVMVMIERASWSRGANPARTLVSKFFWPERLHCPYEVTRFVATSTARGRYPSPGRVSSEEIVMQDFERNIASLLEALKFSPDNILLKK